MSKMMRGRANQTLGHRETFTPAYRSREGKASVSYGHLRTGAARVAAVRAEGAETCVETDPD